MTLRQNFEKNWLALAALGLGMSTAQACANAPPPTDTPAVDTNNQTATGNGANIDMSTGTLGTTGNTTGATTTTTGQTGNTGAGTTGAGTTTTNTADMTGTTTGTNAMTTGAGGAAGTAATAMGGAATTTMTASGGAAATTTASGGAMAAAGGSATTTVMDDSSGGSECSTPPAASTADQSITPASAGVDEIGVYAVFSYGDGTTTMGLCGSMGEVCMSGTVAAQGADFSNWGAGLGFQFAQGTTPYDASAFTSVSFTVSGTIPTGIRPGITLTSNSDKAFVPGTGMDDAFVPGDITAAGAQTLAFSELVQPPESWGGDPTLTWDATDIQSVQFQINAATAAGAYDFCISDLTFQ